MNIKLIKSYIEEYKKQFDKISDLEIYKWKAVKQFQDNWDIHSSDFYSMLERSLKGVSNLLDSGQYYPQRMLLQNIEKEPEKIKTMFENLFDEDKDIYKRIESFQSEFENLNSTYFKGKKGYQDDRAVIVYLTLRYPDRYFFYKYTMFKDFSEKIDYTFKPIRGRIDNIGQFQTLCRLIRHEISQDQALLKLHKNRLTEDCYIDDNLYILTQDFIFAVAYYLNITFSGRRAESKEVIFSTINSSDIELTELKIDLKPRTINYIQNDIENKRIGDLGELWVIDRERKKLISAKKLELAEKVEHVAKSSGDGLGYDILSYDKDGNKLFIEVKTTKGDLYSTFYITRNELEKSKMEGDFYRLYRVYNFDEENDNAECEIIKGDLSDLCKFPMTFKVNMKKPVGEDSYLQ